MFGTGLSLPQVIAVAALPLIFALTVHEIAHGWVAKRLGDPTAERLGRLSFNPLRHIDPIGTVVLPVLLLAIGGFVFGWAKPVPVTYENLRHPKRDMALVAVAGPGANFVMAIFWAVFLKVGAMLPETATWVALPLIYMGQFGILINLVFMIINLLPIPPLDGGRVAVSALPDNIGWQLSRIEPYGIFVALAVIILGWESLIQPVLSFFLELILRLLGLS
jgi:Zn-dependent protease